MDRIYFYGNTERKCQFAKVAKEDGAMLAPGKEAIRIKVQKYECKLPTESRKFSVDPQITSLEELRSILVTAFDIKGDFTLSYKSIDDAGQEDFLALFSDWDLDAAFLRAQNASCLSGSEPYIHLRIDVKSESRIENSDVKRTDGKVPIQRSHSSADQTPSSELKQLQIGFQGMIMNHMEKTINLVSRALNLSEDPDVPPRPPLNQTEFLSFLSPVGHVVQGGKLRQVIYSGGVDPSFRKVVWKHILNVYPEGMSGKERLDYMKKKSAEYVSLRDVWKECLQNGQNSSNLSYVTNMVRKDVLRTDRHHKFYSGSDDNQNITSLFNILTTYALNHPVVSYCQGMSDLASPLLVVMSDEAHAYICLCALMNRLYPNFLLDGEAMTLKFTHLSESLQIYDPIFYTYLQNQQADDLLFCYRWLLLEMKREFAFDDALHMLEVLWSSLPSNPPEGELSLKEKEFVPNSALETAEESSVNISLKTPRENAYTKLCAIRRQSSSYCLTTNSKGKFGYKRMNHSLDENIGKRNYISSYQISKEYQSLDENFMNAEYSNQNHDSSSKESLKSLTQDVNSRNFAKNKYFPSLNKNFESYNEEEEGDVSRKLIKNLSEFKNIAAIKKVNNVDVNQKVTNKENCEPNDDIEEENESADLIESDLKNGLENKPSNSTNEVLDNRELKLEKNDEVFVWENPLHNNLDIKNPFHDLSSSNKTFATQNGQKTKFSPDGSKPNSKFFSNMSQELENARKNCEMILSQKRSPNLQTIASTISNFQKKYELHTQSSQGDSNSTHPCEEVDESNCSKPLSLLLPSSGEFGGGNPFLIFLCLTLLMQHRDYIMRNQMDYNELAMYFDKMVRKHNVHRVLNHARRMYTSYLKDQSR